MRCDKVEEGGWVSDIGLVRWCWRRLEKMLVLLVLLLLLMMMLLLLLLSLVLS